MSTSDVEDNAMNSPSPGNDEDAEDDGITFIAKSPGKNSYVWMCLTLF